MDRLTSDSPDGNFETMLNFVYRKDGWAYIRHDGEHENVLLTDWAKRQCWAHGCDEVLTETPEEIDQRLCDCMVDSGSVICPIAMAYCFASQACHMRSRLKMYEDSCLTPDEIYQHRFIIAANKDPKKLSRLRELIDADADGRLVVLPCKVGDTLYIIYHGIIEETKVRTFFLGHPSHNVEKRNMRMIRTTNWDISMDEIGKTIFLTREEAEAALEKREEADNEAD